MTISDKDRKILWGESANRCCYCKEELVIDESVQDPHSVVGEECHIYGKKPNSARYSKSYPKDHLDKYENFILLCNIHHKLVDDQPNKHTVEYLKKLKSNHENWIKSTLKLVETKKADWSFHFLSRIQTGRKLMLQLSGIHSGIFDYDEPSDQSEADALSEFMTEVQDTADVGDDVELGEKAKWEWRISEQIRKLEDYNFLVFAKRYTHTVKVGKRTVSDWEIGILKVAKVGASGITEDGNLLALVELPTTV